MRGIFTAGLLLSALACVPAAAADRVVTQQEMNADAESAFKAADAALNAMYQKELASKSSDVEGTRKLVEAERLWIKFRDAECESEADDYRGGSMAPMVRAACAKRLTEARTAELQARLDDH